MVYQVLVLHRDRKSVMKKAVSALQCPQMSLRFFNLENLFKDVEPEPTLPSAIFHLVVIKTETLKELGAHKDSVVNKVAAGGSVLCLLGVSGTSPVLSSKEQQVVYYPASQFTQITQGELLEGLQRKFGDV